MPRGIALSPLGLTLAAAVVALGGCAADSGDEGILVLKNVAAQGDCTVSATEAERSIGHGTLDVLLPSGYLFIAQMKSRITAVAGQEDLRTVITTGAKIDIEFPGSQVFSEAELAELRTSGLTRLMQPFSVPIKPNGGITDAGFQLITAALAARIAMKGASLGPYGIEAIATFTIEGKMSGQTVTSQPFTYPITIGPNVTVHVAGACPLPTDFGTPRTGYACNPAQDGTVDCCTDGAALKCPASVATM